MGVAPQVFETAVKKAHVEAALTAVSKECGLAAYSGT
jgi:hypothetical protein